MNTDIEKEIDHNVYSAVRDMIWRSCHDSVEDTIYNEPYHLTSFAITSHVRGTVGISVRINIDNQIYEKRFS